MYFTVYTVKESTSIGKALRFVLTGFQYTKLFTLKHAAVPGYPFFLGSGLLQISVPGVPNLTR
jgi:hypothetical protein